MRYTKMDNYGELYLDWKKRRGVPRPYSARTIDRIKKLIAGDILEIGPGDGDNICLLVNPKIKTYTAVEPDKKLLTRLRDKIAPLSINDSIYCDFFPTDKIENRTFDTILSFEVIEHSASPKNFLAECKKILRPGGNIIISTPNKYIYRTVAKLVDGGPDRTHISEMTYKAFADLFAKYFDIIYANYTLPLFPRISQRFKIEKVFSASEDIAKVVRFISLNVLLVGKRN